MRGRITPNPGVGSAVVLFGAAAHGLLVLRIGFNVAPAMPPMMLGVIALAPLIANALYNRLRRPNPRTS